MEGNIQNDLPANSLMPLCSGRVGNNSSYDAKEVRETLKEYVFNDGAVSWQWGKFTMCIFFLTLFLVKFTMS